MYHVLLQKASFWMFLLQVDEELAETARQKKCAHCGGRLHRANYRRKPAGGPDDLDPQCRLRFSFCCDREGCRKRTTPPSVRFLGRKVYLGAVVVLVAAMRQGTSPKRVRQLSELFDVDRRTLSRWRVFWNELFPQTQFWREARARLSAAGDIVDLPRSLLETFVCHESDRQGWKRLLLFLSPITITRGLKITVSAN